MLASLGSYQQGKTVQSLARQSEWRELHILSPARIGTEAERANLLRIRDDFLLFYAGAIGLIFVGRGARLLNERLRGTITLTYPDRSAIVLHYQTVGHFRSRFVPDRVLRKPERVSHSTTQTDLKQP